MSYFRALVVAVPLALGLSFGASGSAPAQAAPAISSLTSSPVTVFAASWCSACRSLERGLTEREIPFDVIDVEKNPAAFDRARDAAKAGSSIPLTGVAHNDDTVWIVGADIDAVDRAYHAK